MQEQKKSTLDAWILEHAGDPMYRFGHQQAGGVVDPSSQTEDLGDDAVKASEYGIANLKRIVPNLIEWTSEKGENYDNLEAMYGQVVSQFNRYMGHVSSNIGGVYENYKTSDQEGAVYTYVSKEHQENCLNFVQENLFETPYWMIDKDIISRTQYSGISETIRRSQVRTLNNILNPGRMTRMAENQALNGSSAYYLEDMMEDLRTGVFSEVKSGDQTDSYRRNLQRAYIERMDYILNDAIDVLRGPSSSYVKTTFVKLNESEVIPMVKGELMTLQKDLTKAAKRSKSNTEKYHYEDLSNRITNILKTTK
jgi:hypothetical protein